MNKEKLANLEKLGEQVRIGGKGTARRKRKVVHKTVATDDKKLQATLKKLAVNNIQGIEEVNIVREDGTLIHFNNPKVQASLSANVFAITGHAENKQLGDILPSILPQLGTENLASLKKLMAGGAGGRGTAGLGDLARLIGSAEGADGGAAAGGNDDGDDEEVPELVGNFDEPSKKETTAATTTE